MTPGGLLVSLALLGGSLLAQDPGPAAEPVDLPRALPLTPAEALRTFELAEGLRIELVAAEPWIRDPVALAFDAAARLYVVEMRDYSEQRDAALGSVRRLVDRDGDGRYDESQPFADDLPWPTAIACWRDGVFVAAAPDVLYLRDLDGDGRADERRVVLTGFRHTNVQGLVNSLRYGPDHRIHGATSRSGGRVRRPSEDPARGVELLPCDFAFDPDTLELVRTSGGGQHGFDFDPAFAKFVCSNSNHAQHVLFPHRVLERHTFVPNVPVLRDIALEGPQADVFRASPVEPWRIVRTRWRVAGLVPGPIERGGRAAGYFTGASGMTIYADGLLPSVGGDAMLIVGDVGSNLLHRKALRREGVSFTARRTERDHEFLRSRDPWFRPVTTRCGPDGALWVADMYREVVEHPASLPPPLKERLDLTSGRDRGRIWRVVPEDHVGGPLPDLERAADLALVPALDDPRTWMRTTALRLLRERRARGVAPALRALWNRASPTGRIHALVALAGVEALAAGDLERALIDPEPRVRAFCLEAFEDACCSTDSLRDRLVALAADEDVLVRHRLAVAAHALDANRRTTLLLSLARRDDGEDLVRHAIASSLPPGETAAFLAHLLDDDEGTALPEHLAHELLERLFTRGALRSPQELRAVLLALERRERARPGSAAFALEFLAAHAGSRGEARADAPWQAAPLLLERAEQLRASARRDATDPALDLELRVRAVARLATFPESEVLGTLEACLEPRSPAPLQREALRVLERFASDAVAQTLLRVWSRATPERAGDVARVLVSRASSAHALLDAVDEQRVAWAALELHARERLLAHPDPALRGRALALAQHFAPQGPPIDADRQARVLAMPGDSANGRAAFREACASCHRLEDHGHALGPDLRGTARRGRAALWLAIAEPNRDLDPQYVDHVLEHADGRLLSGLVRDETDHALTLVGPNGAQDVVRRADIRSLRRTGRSPMPEGLLDAWDDATIAGLLRYLEDH